MKAVIATLSALVAVLAVAVGWLVFDRIEQRRDFESLVSHFNALEEGVAMQETIGILENRLLEVEERGNYAHRLIGELTEVDKVVVKRFSKHQDSIDLIFDMLRR